jgi:hypothetical protein
LLESGVQEIRRDKIAVELTDWVEPVGRTRAHAWYRFATGTYFPITEHTRPFEVEPEYALLVNRGHDITIYLNTFSLEAEAIVAMDVARDAVFAGRSAEAARIARAALPHAHPLFLALVTKEKNLLSQRGAV